MVEKMGNEVDRWKGASREVEVQFEVQFEVVC
jgi:hypothetical protein